MKPAEPWVLPPLTESKMSHQAQLSNKRLMRQLDLKKGYEEEMEAWLLTAEDEAKKHFASIKRLLGPPWYQELAEVQQDNAGILIMCMRDDLHEGQTYRTRNCLAQIGFFPTPTDEKVKKLLRSSKKKPIPFLLELFKSFRDRDPYIPYDEYSLNERLALSSIAHMTLYVTLRELDRRLPPPVVVKIEKEDVEDRIQTVQEPSRRPPPSPILLKNADAKYPMYLEQQPWPKFPKNDNFQRFDVRQPCFSPYDQPETARGLVDPRPELSKKKKKKDCVCDTDGEENEDGEDGGS